jgi:hypothetical protein
MVLACEGCYAPLLNFAQSLFAFNDVHVGFVNARWREFALIQEFLDNRNRFRRDVRIVLELIRNCEHIHARLKGEQHHLLVAIVVTCNFDEGRALCQYGNRGPRFGQIALICGKLG